MSMFGIGLSGMTAASADLRVTGNNIANANTTGFKESRAEFAELFAQSYSGTTSTAIGKGVRLVNVAQQFDQGNIEITSNPLDLAISGSGFFVMDEPDGSRVFTRAGEFQLDRDGYISNSTGNFLQGYAAADQTDIDTNFNLATTDRLRLTSTNAPANATTSIEAIVNLQSAAEAPTGTFAFSTDTTADTNDPDVTSYNFSTTVTVYDEQGLPRDLTMYFVKNDGADPPAAIDPLDWSVYVGMRDAAGVMQDASQAGGPAVLTFNSDGTIASIADAGADAGGNATSGDIPGGTLSIFFGDPTADPDDPFGNNGASAITAQLDFRQSTQYGTEFSINELTQDGYTTGSLSSIDVDEKGRVFARFTNGEARVMGQVAMVDFKNPQGLLNYNDGVWVESIAAGDARYGAPGSDSFGEIQSGALENSNVDLASQLVNLITAQRQFQANAQTISAADTVSQTIINI
jgi:flagellar hook protein FlgE